jgi:hypothetical protein
VRAQATFYAQRLHQTIARSIADDARRGRDALCQVELCQVELCQVELYQIAFYRGDLYAARFVRVSFIRLSFAFFIAEKPI